MPSPASAAQSSQSDPSCWSDGDGGGDGGALLLVAAVGPVGGATVGVGGVVDFVPGWEVVVSSDGVSVEPTDVVASVGVSVVVTGPAVCSDVGFAVDVGSEEVEGSSDVFVTSVGRDSAVLVESVVTGLAELVGDVELVAGSLVVGSVVGVVGSDVVVVIMVVVVVSGRHFWSSPAGPQTLMSSMAMLSSSFVPQAPNTSSCGVTHVCDRHKTKVGPGNTVIIYIVDV